MEFTPAIVDGKPVPALITSLLGMDMSYDVEVKNGKVSLVKSALTQWNQIVESGGKQR